MFGSDRDVICVRPGDVPVLAARLPPATPTVDDPRLVGRAGLLRIDVGGAVVPFFGLLFGRAAGFL